MKKIYALMLIATMLFIGTGSFAADATQTAKDSLRAQVDSTLINVSEAAGLVNQTLGEAHVDFGGATDLKDSIVAVFATLQTDSGTQELKEKALEIYDLGKQAQEEKRSWFNQKMILAILGFILLAVGWFSRHFGVFTKKK